jgi:hypothetical protein
MKLSDVVIDDRDFDRPLDEWVREISDLYDNWFGSVNNIAFDLRHALLPREEWTMPALGISSDGVREDTDQPKIWFPWFGPAELGSIWPIYRKPRIFQEIPVTIEVILKSFDQIVIERVVSVATDHVLEHQHDSEIRCAYLLIKHPDGTTTRPNIPLVFRGRNELLNSNHPFNVLPVIEHRLSEYCNTKVSEHGNKYAERSLYECQSVRDMLEYQEFYDFNQLVDRSILLGYLCAKAETELEIKHKALASIKASEASSRGGKQTAGKNKDKADKAWRLEAAPCVKKIYQEDSSRSYSAIIDLLSTRLKDNDALPHGEKTLNNFVRNMRRTGQIGPRIPKSKLARTHRIAKK